MYQTCAGLYSWSFSIVCRYKKRRTGIKLPFVSFQYAEQLQSHSAKSIQTQSRSAPQKGIVIPYKCYTTYKPNKRAQADLSAHRPDGLRLRGGNRAKFNNNSYIPLYDVYVKSERLQYIVLHWREVVFTMRILYVLLDL